MPHDKFTKATDQNNGIEGFWGLAIGPARYKFNGMPISYRIHCLSDATTERLFGTIAAPTSTDAGYSDHRMKSITLSCHYPKWIGVILILVLYSIILILNTGAQENRATQLGESDN